MSWQIENSSLPDGSVRPLKFKEEKRGGHEYTAVIELPITDAIADNTLVVDLGEKVKNNWPAGGLLWWTTKLEYNNKSCSWIEANISMIVVRLPTRPPA